MTKQNKVAELGDCVAYVTVTKLTFDLRTNGPHKNKNSKLYKKSFGKNIL